VDDTTFGLGLRRVRLRRDERQDDVAERAGVSQATYSEIDDEECGRRRMSAIQCAQETVDIDELGLLRLARRIASDRGWQPRTISAWVVLANSRTNRRHAAAAGAPLRAAFPEDGRAVAGWLRRPVRRQLALWFLTDDSEASLRRALAPRKRVAARSPRSSPPARR
jgi:transcriptional regulator with XRE-family HTH domain